jgi:hypothetical protein
MRLIALTVAIAFAASSAAAAPALDANGKCRDGGKFVAQSMCAKPAQAGRCRDKTTKKFVKCGTANSERVPAAAGK